MNTDTRKRILEIATTTGGVRPHELVRLLKISPVAIHKHLKELVKSGLLEKRGKPPSVIYVASTASTPPAISTIPAEHKEEIERHFCYFTPSGEELDGVSGFIAFLERTGQAQDPTARALEYIEILHTAERFKDPAGLVDGTRKVSDTFEQCFISKLYYSDFYSLPKYGKTRLGQFLLHGKSGQNLKLIQTIAALTKAHVQDIITTNSIEAIAFAPHSIPRKIPFLKEYRKLLNLSLPDITLTKAFSGDVPIAQKSLSKLAERIENARQTIFVKDSSFPYSRVLVIDDALGSGATLNEIARKLKSAGRGTEACEIFGYAIVGSYKGFEVIKEV